MAQHDPRVTEAKRAGRVDIWDFPHLQCAGAHDPGAVRDHWDGDRQDHVLGASAEGSDNGQRDDDGRKRHEDIHHTLQDQVEQATQIGAGDAQDQADGGAEKCGHKTNEQCGLRAIDYARENIPPELIGAEPKVSPRRGQHIGEVVWLRIVGRYKVCEGSD